MVWLHPGCHDVQVRDDRLTDSDANIILMTLDHDNAHSLDQVQPKQWEDELVGSHGSSSCSLERGPGVSQPQPLRFELDVCHPQQMARGLTAFSCSREFSYATLVSSSFPDITRHVRRNRCGRPTSTCTQDEELPWRHPQ